MSVVIKSSEELKSFNGKLSSLTEEIHGMNLLVFESSSKEGTSKKEPSLQEVESLIKRHDVIIKEFYSLQKKFFSFRGFFSKYRESWSRLTSIALFVVSGLVISFKDLFKIAGYIVGDDAVDNWDSNLKKFVFTEEIKNNFEIIKNSLAENNEKLAKIKNDRIGKERVIFKSYMAKSVESFFTNFLQLVNSFFHINFKLDKEFFHVLLISSLISTLFFVNIVYGFSIRFILFLYCFKRMFISLDFLNILNKEYKTLGLWKLSIFYVCMIGSFFSLFNLYLAIIITSGFMFFRYVFIFTVEEKKNNFDLSCEIFWKHFKEKELDLFCNYLFKLLLFVIIYKIYPLLSYFASFFEKRFGGNSTDPVFTNMLLVAWFIKEIIPRTLNSVVEYAIFGDGFWIDDLKDVFSLGSFNWNKFLRGFLYGFVVPIISFAFFLLSGGSSYLIPNFVFWKWLAFSVFNIILVVLGALSEEIECRRFNAGSWYRDNNFRFILSLIFFPLLFAYIHIGNPEFSSIKEWGGFLHMFARYFLTGLNYSLVSVFSGGIELSWGEHIANNIYLSLFLGYRPSPLNTYSLIIVDRSSMYESFNDLAFTVGDFFSYLGESLLFVMKFGFFESFFRPVYAVKPVEYYQVKFRELKGKEEENIIYKKKGLLKSSGLFLDKSMNIFSKRGSSSLTYPASFLGRMSSIFGSG